MHGFRSLTRADLPALLKLLLAANQADGNATGETVADLEHEFEDPWSDPARDAVVIAGPDGALVGFARVFVNPVANTDPASAAFLTYSVHPDARGTGLEEDLLDWLEARGRERLKGSPTHRLRVAHAEQLADEIDRLRRRGYRPVRYYFRMRRDIDPRLPEVALPDGITLRAFTPEWSSALWVAHAAAFGDHWGYVIETPAEFEAYVLGNSAFRADLTVLACVGPDVVAYSINRVPADENARTGIREGVIGLLGTQRAWRGRGLAHALIQESLRRFAADGLQRVALTVDAENTTGALGLYERLGFAVYKRVQALDLDLTGP